MEEASWRIEVMLAQLLENRSQHSGKVRALKRFRAFMEKEAPELFDDDVDVLLLGKEDDLLPGLLHWCGTPSENHEGKLKRHCAPAIHLLRFVVDYKPKSGGDNFVRERFRSLSLEQYGPIAFRLHLTEENKGGGSRSGNYADALALLLLVLEDHRSHPSMDPAPLRLCDFVPSAAQQQSIVAYCAKKGLTPPEASAPPRRCLIHISEPTRTGL